MWKLVALVAVMVCSSEAYRTVPAVRRAQVGGRCRAAMDGSEEQPEREERPAPAPKLNFFQKLMQGLDDVVDDALDRKLGNGGGWLFARVRPWAHACAFRFAPRVSDPIVAPPLPSRPRLDAPPRAANFYGKRKSNFYGQEDEFKKKDPRVASAEEDYRGNKGGSYFVRAAVRSPRSRDASTPADRGALFVLRALARGPAGLGQGA